MTPSALRELRAFRQFCELREINVTDIEERPPPEPDVLANVENAKVVFELTEAVEPDYARKLSDMYKTPKLIRDGYDAPSARHRGAWL